MTSQMPAATTATTTQRIGWAVLILVTLFICYFSHLGVIGFVGPDEPRYAWIARDMAESGDWVTPRLYGQPWFEKPPLLYWGGAVFFRLIPAQPEIAARLPSAISALLATLALAWLAWRTYGEECARWVLLLLPTSVAMIGFSHAAATDMPFAGMLTIAMVCAAVVLGLTRADEKTPILPPAPCLALLLFGFFLGLAVLAKGPAAIILSGGAILFWAVFTKHWRDALRLLHPAAIVSFCVTSLPWYILCARRNPDFFRVFIIEHNFKRFLTPEFQHVQPFWFYLPVVLIAFLPWSILVVVSAAAGVRQLWRTRRTSELTCLMLIWASFCMAFFTISKSKLPGYVLPAVPPIGLLLAQIISRNAIWRRSTTGILLFCSAGCYLIVAVYLRTKAAALLAGVDFHRLPYEQIVLACLIAVLFIATAVVAGLTFLTPSNSRSEILLVGVAVLLLATSFGLLPQIASRAHLDLLSGKALARSLQSKAGTSEPLRVFGFRRDYRYALNFYLHQEIPDWTADPISNGFVLSEHSDCNRLKTTDHCVDLWDPYDRNVDWGLLKITPVHSFQGPGGGGEPK